MPQISWKQKILFWNHCLVLSRWEMTSPTYAYAPSHIPWENKRGYHQPPSAWRTEKYPCQGPSPYEDPDDTTWAGTLHAKNVFCEVQQAGTPVLLELCCISAQSRAASPPGAVLHLSTPGGCQDNPCSSNAKHWALIMPWTDAPAPSFLL